MGQGQTSPEKIQLPRFQPTTWANFVDGCGLLQFQSSKAWYSYDGASFLSLVFATKPYATEYVDVEKEKPHIISYYTVLPLPDKQCW